MKRLECTSPTSMPAADVSIAHLLIHPTIPLPRPWTPSSSMHSSTSTDWRSSTATAGWQWQAAAAGARAPFGLQLGPVAPCYGQQQRRKADNGGSPLREQISAMPERRKSRGIGALRRR